jgi:aryl-alcohol dehydrogenase-like predicted oxidoreductase
LVGSKWGYTYTADWRVEAEVHEVKDHSLATLRRQIAESRGILGRRLRLYQIHSATLESGVLEDADVLRELVGLRESGLAIGLTVSGPGQAETIRRALEVEVDGENPFQAVQATWNVLETSAGPALAEAHGAGWGVLVKEAMANGRLGPRGDAAAALEPIARRLGVGVDAVALGFAFAQPWADVVLSGAVTPAQLVSNVDAARIELGVDDLEAIGRSAEVSAAYWVRRSQLSWS